MCTAQNREQSIDVSTETKVVNLCKEVCQMLLAGLSIIKYTDYAVAWRTCASTSSQTISVSCKAPVHVCCLYSLSASI